LVEVEYSDQMKEKEGYDSWRNNINMG
jgi:hypothetical protein